MQKCLLKSCWLSICDLKLPIIVYACVSFLVYSLKKAAVENFDFRILRFEYEKTFRYESVDGPKFIQPDHKYVCRPTAITHPLL